MEICFYFDILDEFMGLRDIVNLFYFVEIISKSFLGSLWLILLLVFLIFLVSEELEGNVVFEENFRKVKKYFCEDINKVDCEDGSGDGKKGGKVIKKRKCLFKGFGQSDDDLWLVIFRESQE